MLTVVVVVVVVVVVNSALRYASALYRRVLIHTQELSRGTRGRAGHARCGAPTR